MANVWAVVENATGRLDHLHPTDPTVSPGLPAGYVAQVVAEPAPGQVWDRALRAFVAGPPPSKDQLEQASLLPAWTTWWRWKTTRDEAAARSVAAGTLTALTNKANAAWADYAAAIQAWVAAS